MAQLMLKPSLKRSKTKQPGSRSKSLSYLQPVKKGLKRKTIMFTPAYLTVNLHKSAHLCTYTARRPEIIVPLPSNLTLFRRFPKKG
jgi:hypothetical protein